MANFNRRNPNAPEPTLRSARAAGKRPTASSPLLRRTWYDNKGDKRKDPLETLAIQTGTESKTQRKDLLKDLRKEDLLIEALGKPIDAPPLLPPAPPLLPPLALGTMPSLVPPQDAVLVARRYPEQGNWSPFLIPPKEINPASLVDGYDMTPLDHMSPAAATLDQIRYAQEHIGGDKYKNCEDEDDDKNCEDDDDDDDDAEEHIFGEDDNDSKDGDYKDRG